MCGGGVLPSVSAQKRWTYFLDHVPPSTDGRPRDGRGWGYWRADDTGLSPRQPSSRYELTTDHPRLVSTGRQVASCMYTNRTLHASCKPPPNAHDQPAKTKLTTPSYRHSHPRSRKKRKERNGDPRKTTMVDKRKMIYI